MTTLGAILDDLVQSLQIGWAGTITSAATTSVTDTSRFQNSNWGNATFRNWWLERTTATAADRVRPISSLATGSGVLTHAGANYADTGTPPTHTAYRIWRPEYHPTLYVIPAVNRALKMAWTWWRAPLTPVANGDGESASVGGSDSSATTTRDTTAADVWDGEASLRVANSGANGYHQFADFDVGAGRAFRMTAMVRITVGTARAQVVARGGAQSGTVLAQATATGIGEFQYIQFSGTFPSDCHKATVRIGADEATGDTNWDDVTLYWEPVTRIAGPSWLHQFRNDDGEEMLRLYRRQNRIVGDGVGPGRAYDLIEIDSNEYQVSLIPQAANPIQIELGRNLTSDQYPIGIESRRDYHSFLAADLSANTDTTGCPQKLAVAATKYLMAKERGWAGIDGYYLDYLAEQRREQSAVRKPPPDQRRGMAYQRIG